MNYEEFNRPEYVKVDIEEYQKLKEKIEIYELTIKALKELDNKEINKILESMYEALN